MDHPAYILNDELFAFMQRHLLLLMVFDKGVKSVASAVVKV